MQYIARDWTNLNCCFFLTRRVIVKKRCMNQSCKHGKHGYIDWLFYVWFRFLCRIALLNCKGIQIKLSNFQAFLMASCFYIVDWRWVREMRESECENVLLLMWVSRSRVAPHEPPLFVNKYTCESENCKSLSKFKIFIKKMWNHKFWR